MQSVIPPHNASERVVIAGQQQGFLGLAIVYGETTSSSHPGVVFPMMRTAYQPTDAEIAAIVAGAPIIMEELAPPPITPRRIYVGSAPE